MRRRLLETVENGGGLAGYPSFDSNIQMIFVYGRFESQDDSIINKINIFSNGPSSTFIYKNDYYSYVYNQGSTLTFQSVLDYGLTIRCEDIMGNTADLVFSYIPQPVESNNTMQNNDNELSSNDSNIKITGMYILPGKCPYVWCWMGSLATLIFNFSKSNLPPNP